ncbi:MAG: hydrolase [Ruminococcaceae bacterium]|nr:hydrolase [Oscillospiraceae bacterium]
MRKALPLFLALAAAAVLLRMGQSAVTADNRTTIPAETKYVALTFDDGPKAGTTDLLLDGLRERGASATFFVVGEQAVIHTDLLRRMQEEGHQVGNHTWSHVRLQGSAPEVRRSEIAQVDALLTEVLGEGMYWLRPPYGQVSPGTEQEISVPMVKWSVDPRDWESRDRKKVVAAVLANTKPNSIILLHDIYPSTVEAALEIVDVLQAQGYVFVTVEELLRLNGVTPQPGVLYRTGTG